MSTVLRIVASLLLGLTVAAGVLAYRAAGAGDTYNGAVDLIIGVLMLGGGLLGHYAADRARSTR